jgi:PQQ-dependent catabolism-associated beta-propeller protein
MPSALTHLTPPPSHPPAAPRRAVRGFVVAISLAMLAATSVHAETVYVSNEKGNSIAVLDAKTLTVQKTIRVGQRPRGIVLSKDAKTLYICASDDDVIQQLDLDTLKLKAPLPNGADPESFALHPDGGHLYVSNEDNNVVSVVDIAARRVIAEIPVGVEPEGVGISPDGKWIVNTSETTSMAHFIDSETRKVVANVLVDGRPRHAEWTSDGKEVWVSSEIGATVSVIDAASHQITHKIAFAVQGVPNDSVHPVGIVLTNDRKLGFVALGTANRVAVIDAATYEVKKYLLVGQRVWNLALNPNETRLYTTNGVSNDISEVDVPNLRVLRSVPVGEQPRGVVVRP